MTRPYITKLEPLGSFDPWEVELRDLADVARKARFDSLSPTMSHLRTALEARAEHYLMVLQARATLEAADTQRMTAVRLVAATWALVIATVALVIVDIVLGG